jgi:transcriptional regulator with XRE-family HTH domain
MRNEFNFDLKVSRRKAGLTQRDEAHLLGIHPSKVSLMESGKAMPSIREIAALTVIYGRSYESLFQSVVHEVQLTLKDRLRTMPASPQRWLLRFNRQHTLDTVADRLDVIDDEYETA